MLWKSIAGAAAVGFVLVGPANAAQEALNSGDRNEAAKSYQTFLSATKTVGLADILNGDVGWNLSAAMDGARAVLSDGNADSLHNLGGTGLAEVLTHHLLPGQTFGGSDAIELLEFEAENWQQLMMSGSDDVSAVSDGQIAIDNVPPESLAEGEGSGKTLSPSS